MAEPVVHRYRVQCSWVGSTSAAYDRTHVVTTTPPTGELMLSADPAFRGDPALRNPEQLLVIAASSCQLLSFLAVASRARLDVIAYEDDAEAEMPDAPRPTRITRIVLRPRITVRGPVDDERVRHLIDVAHRACFIANSLRTEVEIEPTIDVVVD